MSLYVIIDLYIWRVLNGRKEKLYYQKRKIKNDK